MADVNTNKHCLLRDLFSEAHSPKISSQFRINLTEDVHVDTIISSLNVFGSNKLRDDGVIIVDLILKGVVELVLS